MPAPRRMRARLGGDLLGPVLEAAQRRADLDVGVERPEPAVERRLDLDVDPGEGRDDREPGHRGDGGVEGGRVPPRHQIDDDLVGPDRHVVGERRQRQEAVLAKGRREAGRLIGVAGNGAGDPLDQDRQRGELAGGEAVEVSGRAEAEGGVERPGGDEAERRADPERAHHDHRGGHPAADRQHQPLRADDRRQRRPHHGQRQRQLQEDHQHRAHEREPHQDQRRRAAAAARRSSRCGGRRDGRRCSATPPRGSAPTG